MPRASSRWRAAAMAGLAFALAATLGNPAGAQSADSTAAAIRHQRAVLDPQADTGEAVGTPVGAPSSSPVAGHLHTTAAATPMTTTTTVPPEVGGQWAADVPFDRQFNAIHQIPSPYGDKVLLVAGSGNNRTRFDSGTFRSFVWEPSTGVRREVPTPEDLFCSGHVLLPDGRALVAGGTASYGPPFTGADFLYAFNFVTETYEQLSDMEVGRWYPSTITGPDGRTLIVSGLDASGITTRVNEVFDYRTDQVTTLPGLRSFPLYPQIYLTARSTYFYTGAPGRGTVKPGLWDPFNGNTYQQVPGLAVPAQREAATSCFVGDVRRQTVMVMGGGWPATASTSVVDLRATSPAFRDGPPLLAAKGYLSCLNLPDGTLLEANGGSANAVEAASTEVGLLASPAGPWTAASPLPAGDHRLYHAMLFLLDDGRVVSMSSNPKGQTRSHSVLVYSPPYLFAGTRPVITAAPAQMARGRSYPVAASTTGATLARVTLTAAGTSTHSTDPNQRYVSLPVNSGRFYVPPSGAILPPGWYRLWAVDSAGRVSTARWVQIAP